MIRMYFLAKGMWYLCETHLVGRFLAKRTDLKCKSDSFQFDSQELIELGKSGNLWRLYDVFDIDSIDIWWVKLSNKP